MQIELGTHVKLWLPMSDMHGHTGTVTQRTHGADGQVLIARVQIDGSDDAVVVHHTALRTPTEWESDEH